MSRLDDHVAAVQNKLTLGHFLVALARGSVVAAGVLLLGTLVDRLFLLHPPKPVYWIGGLIVALIAYAFWSASRLRPDSETAAVAIDAKLGLKEKISSALYLRRSDDPFAREAVRDAETSAANVVVNLRQHFPLQFPRLFFLTLTLLLASALAYELIDPMHLFDRQEKHDRQIAQDAQAMAAKQNVEKALATVNAVIKADPSSESLNLAKNDLQALLQKPIKDPAAADRTATRALQDASQAIKEQIKTSSKFAQAQNEMKMLSSMQTPQDGQGPVSDAQRDMAKGDFQKAVDELTKAVENFGKADKAQQQQMAQQMQQLAQQLQQAANNPAQQQQMQQKMQQMGMNPQQAQQAQQLMQQAAQGDKQAQQQLQQMAQQQMKQMNNGQGPTPQQQQLMQKMMQQMQAQANAQQQAQQMSQSAQQMAQAMQQAQQAQQQQSGQQQQQQQGKQPGQQPGQQQGQQMSQAMQQMQQQLQQMQAQAQDAQQIAAAQQAASGDSQNGANGQGGQPGGQNQTAGQWSGSNASSNANGNGNPNGKGGANAQAGKGGGMAQGNKQAPFGLKSEVDPSKDDSSGRLLANTFIKDNKPFKGESTATLQDVAKAAQEDASDEVDPERVSRQAESAVKNYFNSMQNDAK